MRSRIIAGARGLEELLELGGTTKDMALLAISGATLLVSIFEPVGLRETLPFDPAWVAIVLCGVPIICEAIIGLVTEFDITADVLVALALIASVTIGETFAAGEVAFIMQLGGLLEELTVARARAGIERLVHLTPRTARRISCPGEAMADAVAAACEADTAAMPADLAPDRDETVDAQAVQVGDILRVNPGETIPVDGVIVRGETSINQAVMTGESMPADKGPGDEVSSGTVNQFGSFDMRAVKVGEDSSIQRMVRLVQSADAGKAKIVNLADRRAVWIVAIALGSAAITWLVSGQIIRAVTILVVFCPCALVLATPTAIMAAIGNATRHGFLVREGDALERLAQVSRVAFDKTGTLTLGKPEVVAVEGDGKADSFELYALAASAELKSEHPLGKAIVAGYLQAKSARAGNEEGNRATIAEPIAFTMLPGRGVEATCTTGSGKTRVIAGNLQLMDERGLSLPSDLRERAAHHLRQGRTVTYLACTRLSQREKDVVDASEETFFGLIALADTPREDASDTIRAIEATGVAPALLTGDNEGAAAAVAHSLGIRDHKANCRPEDKLAWVEQSESSGKPVCMVGDGVNDAPALKRAFVGIAMGGVGSDIAVDAADIALVNDDIRELSHLIGLSRRMMRTIRLNMAFSLTLNFIAIALAITGVLDPVTGALVHNTGSVLVISNSALLLRWHRA